MRWRWIALGVVLLALVYVFRAPLLALGCNLALRWTLPGSEHDFSFQEAKLRDGVLTLTDLHLDKGEYRLDAQELRLAWKEGLHIDLEAPQIFVTELPEMGGEALLLTQLHVNASHGVLQLPHSPRLFFTIDNDEVGHRLVASLNPGDEAPLLIADLEMGERRATLHYALDVDGELIMKCAALLPEKLFQLERLGKVEAEGTLISDGKSLLSGKLAVHLEKLLGASKLGSVSCERSELFIDLKEAEGVSFVERLTLQLRLAEGKVKGEGPPLAVQQAVLSLSSDHELAFHAECTLAALPLRLAGSGKLQEKESKLVFNAEGPSSQAHISLEERGHGEWALDMQGHLPQLIDKTIEAQGNLKLSEGALSIDELMLGVGESALRGKLTMGRTGELVLHAHVVEANLAEWLPKVKGRASLHEMTLCGDLMGEFQARGRGKICGVSLYTLENIESEISFDTLDQRLELTNTEGKGSWRGKPFRLVGERIVLHPDKGSFQLELLQEAGSVGKLIGAFTYAKERGVEIAFDKLRSHLFHHHVESMILKGEEEWTLRGELNLSLLQQRFLQGKAQAQLTMANETLRVALESPDFSLAGYRRGTLWTVEKLKVGEILARGEISESDFSIPSFTLTHPLGEVQGEALYHPESEEFDVYCDHLHSELSAWNRTLSGKCEGRVKGKWRLSGSGAGDLFCTVSATAPIFTTIESVKPLHFTYDRDNGFVLLAHDIRCVGALEQLTQLNVHFLDRLTFQGRFRDGEYKKFRLKKLAFQGDVERIAFQGSVDMQVPLELTGELSGAGFQHGKIFLHEREDVMAIDFQRERGDEVQLKKIEGKFPGLAVKLTGGEEETLHGTVRFTGPGLARFLPEEMKSSLDALKLGKGFELQGEFQLGEKPRFSGHLVGDECELLGYVFRKLSSSVQLKERGAQLTQISVEDSAGKLQIKQLKLMKEREEWQLLLPLVEVENLKPSLLRRVGKEKGEEKPFVISRLTLLGISGRLSPDPLLFGTGTLHFSQKEKKEKGLLDVPLDMMKDLGLDPGLLTPIFGELELKLDGDRCRVMAWKNSFSEDHRADFHLAEGREAYIDLKGNLHVDLTMKSHVAWKWSETFSLQLRGSLEHPKYSLALR